MDELQNNENRAMRQSDHDLLVSIHTKVERVINDVKDLNQNISGRVLLLENLKVNKDEYKVDYDDHEKRIRNLERYVWIAIGALAVIQIVLKFIKF